MEDIELHDGEDFEVDDDAEKEVKKLKESVKRRKGRGFGNETKVSRIHYESMEVTDMEEEGKPQRSVEGWIIVARNINEEAQEDDIREKFEEFGEIKNLHLNMDRRTGYAKGYAFIEYQTFKEAEEAIKELDGEELCGQKIEVNWCFVKGPSKKRDARSRRDERRRSPMTHRRSPVNLRRSPVTHRRR